MKTIGLLSYHGNSFVAARWIYIYCLNTKCPPGHHSNDFMANGAL